MPSGIHGAMETKVEHGHGSLLATDTEHAQASAAELIDAWFAPRVESQDETGRWILVDGITEYVCAFCACSLN
jgi:hypothetical protein